MRRSHCFSDSCSNLTRRNRRKHRARQFTNPRRESLKLLGLVSGAAAIPCASFSQSNRAADGLPLTIAGYEFDRCAALVDGRVQPEGCRVNFEISSIGEMNTHVFSGLGTHEVTEIGLSPFMHAFANEDFRGYTLIPVFPLRRFPSGIT